MTTIEGECVEVSSKPVNKPTSSRKNKLRLSGIVAATAFGLTLMGLDVYERIDRPEANVVEYTADPSAPEGTYSLGRPGHLFSVACGKRSNTCSLKIDNDKIHETAKFPYVEQEWYNPKHDNAPYHSIKEIRDLPSFTGNPELRMTSNITANNRVLDILAQNGWVRTTEVPAK